MSRDELFRLDNKRSKFNMFQKWNCERFFDSIFFFWVCLKMDGTDGTDDWVVMLMSRDVLFGSRVLIGEFGDFTCFLSLSKLLSSSFECLARLVGHMSHYRMEWVDDDVELCIKYIIVLWSHLDVTLSHSNALNSTPSPPIINRQSSKFGQNQ